MENQHRKIAGYRELSQEDIDLINAIKDYEAEGLALCRKVRERVSAQRRLAHNDDNPADVGAEGRRLENAEPERWLAIGRTDLQTATMALVRAVAQPEIPSYE